ncbi:sulfotransferase [Aureitalea marina]|nr:sulfotransferase [Aureitalea marina]
MKLKHAIVIHGPGRSGTTMLDNILSIHQDFYWISSYLNKYPKCTELSILNRLTRIGFLERNLRKNRYFPKPNEAYDFWRSKFSNFNAGEQVLVDPEEVERCIKCLKEIQTFASGDRFITKFTGASRANFIDSLFEDPIVLWIDREPKAIIMSYFKQNWHYRNESTERNKKTVIELIDEYSKHLEDVLDRREHLTKFRLKQLYYEDMVSNPDVFFKDLCLELNLSFDERFERRVRNWVIRKNTNTQYKSLLTKSEQAYLHERSIPIAKRMGYI